MAKEYSFTSGQIYAVYEVFGAVPPTSFAGMSKHLGLRAMFQFTAEERQAVNWIEEVAPLGQPDRVGFDNDAALTRRLTGSQRKLIAETIQRAVTMKQPAYFEHWLLPVLALIGYPLAEADWDDDEDDE